MDEMGTDSESQLSGTMPQIFFVLNKGTYAALAPGKHCTMVAGVSIANN